MLLVLVAEIYILLKGAARLYFPVGLSLLQLAPGFWELFTSCGPALDGSGPLPLSAFLACLLSVPLDNPEYRLYAIILSNREGEKQAEKGRSPEARSSNPQVRGYF